MHNLEPLMTSATLQKLHELAPTLPTDVHNRAAFSACGISLIGALDGGRIVFYNELDKAAFLAILTVAVDVVLDGRLKTALVTSAIH